MSFIFNCVSVYVSVCVHVCTRVYTCVPERVYKYPESMKTSDPLDVGGSGTKSKLSAAAVLHH